MLTDPRLSRPIKRLSAQLDRIERAAQTTEDYNDPRSTNRGSGSGVGGPGRQQAEALLKRVAKLIDAAASELKQSADSVERVIEGGYVHENKAEAVKSVGGIEIDETPEVGPVRSRADARVMRQLVDKARRLGAID